MISLRAALALSQRAAAGTHAQQEFWHTAASGVCAPGGAGGAVAPPSAAYHVSAAATRRMEEGEVRTRLLP